MSRIRLCALATIVLSSSALGLVPSASWAAGSTKPRIVAHPDSVMVNTTTQLTGSHFPVSQRITLEECAETMWVVTANPCDANNVKKVTTNARGQFSTVFTVHACKPTAAPGVSQTCYLGQPTPTGVDTLTLDGAVKITVTGP